MQTSERLKKQLDFLLEIDRLKNIYRRTYILGDTDLIDGKEVSHPPRKENDAEHSFHLALFAMILCEYSNSPVDILRVIKMVLVHDLVEIYAGDTYCYDREGNKSKRSRELAAADKLFGILPEDQRAEIRGLWDEFEEAATPESKFANCLDRIQPMLLNYTRDGISWKEHNVRYSDVIGRNEASAGGSEELWEYIKPLIDDARERGLLR